MREPQRIRIFLSSPSDVRKEREVVGALVQRLERDSKGTGAGIELVTWEGLGMPANLTPQEAINRLAPLPSECDLVLVIFGHRFGSPPGTIRGRDGVERLRPDGNQFRSGTEFEYWDAVMACERQGSGRPIVLLYRKRERLQFDADAPDLDEKITQWKLVQSFFENLRTPSGSGGASYHSYASIEEFEERVRGHLLQHVLRLFREKREEAEPPLRAQAVIREPRSGQPAAPSPLKIDSEEFQEILEVYLDWLVQQHGSLDLPGYGRVVGAPSVELERVYVALRANQTSSHEMARAQQLLEVEAREQFVGFDTLSAEEQRQLLAEILGLDPDPSLRNSRLSGRTITLGEAFQKERWLVILGDPGSGKTTLARWIVLKLAVALRGALQRGLSPIWAPVPEGEEIPHVQVPASQVNPETPSDETPVDLGPVRLPVLLRISDYAARAAEERRKGGSLSLIDYLGHQPWLGATLQGIDPYRLNALIRACLSQGRAVILLDGLDEIPQATDRRTITQEVKAFRHFWINFAGRPPSGANAVSPWESLFTTVPFQIGGNQLVLTSRIVGYRAAPIEAMAHVTIQRMRRVAVEHFCLLWMLAVHTALAQSARQGKIPQGDLPAIEAGAREEAEGLVEAIYGHFHRGVQDLATNPLLLTIMALVYRTYGKQLPQHRAELYQAALEILVREWRGTDLNPEEFVFVLAPLAAHMHDHCPNGLISEPELRRVVAKPLAACRPSRFLLSRTAS